MSGPVAALLGDGRLHLQHGPIDLVIGAVGREDEVLQSYRQVTAAFDGVLEGLVTELALLRAPVVAPRPQATGLIARRMVEAVWPHRQRRRRTGLSSTRSPRQPDHTYPRKG